MKTKRYLIIILSLIASNIFSQNIILNPVVDERVELLGIVFRLAGAEEYSMASITSYTKSIDNYFNSFKEDELIKLAKEARKKNGVGYDAVMSLATHIELVNGSFKLKDNVANQSLDKRWGKYTEQFLELLNEFYKKTDFHKFFIYNNVLYSTTEKRFTEVISKIDLTWFEKFFGEKPKGSYNLILSIVNGGGNYGTKIKFTNGNEDIYSIIGAWSHDSLGLPIFSEKYNSTIIHEFNHSFCNYLIDKYYFEIEKNSKGIFKLVKNKMRSMAYGNSKIMIYETLVRSTTIMYFKDHKTSESDLNKMIAREIYYGFISIKPFIKSLEQYEDSRTTYNHLDSYLPRIVTLFNSLNPDELIKDYECIGNAQIVDFSIKNNSNDIDPNIKELMVYFSSPMGYGFGMSYGKGGKKHYPKIKSVNWNNEKRTELKITFELEPNKKYSVILPGKFFLDENYCNLKETYYLNFKTKMSVP